MQIPVYLTFNGQCREAMNFYHQCLGGELNIMLFKDSPVEVPEEQKERVLHAVLDFDDGKIMASDSMPDQPVSTGNNFSLSLDFKDNSSLDSCFQKLTEGGSITMPLGDTFWNAYFGMCQDKFGIGWMFNHDYPARD